MPSPQTRPRVAHGLGNDPVMHKAVSGSQMPALSLPALSSVFSGIKKRYFLLPLQIMGWLGPSQSLLSRSESTILQKMRRQFFEIHLAFPLDEPVRLLLCGFHEDADQPGVLVGRDGYTTLN